MADRSYLSIGDVLTLLREEFPDVTISKIRFLESRGLLVPERTPSGYRKFYDRDVERLRWILRQQREHFLPLKVIKGRLEGAASGTTESLFDTGEPPPPLSAGHHHRGPTRARGSSDHPSVGGTEHRRVGAEARVTALQQSAGSPRGRVLEGAAEEESPGELGQPLKRAGGEPGATSLGVAPEASEAGGPHGERPEGERGTENEAGGAPAPGAAQPAAAAENGALSSPGPGREDHGEGAGGSPAGPARPAADPAGGRRAVSAVERRARDESLLPSSGMTASELAEAASLSVRQVEELESYGLIEGRTIAGVHCFGDEALAVAKVASGFAGFGIEARHLRLFKHAAERQSGLYSQVVMPVLRQRNPQARKRAGEDLVRLSELGSSLQEAFVQGALRHLTGE